MIKKVVLWILVIACMTTIFIFSSQEASSSDEMSLSFAEVFVRFFDFNGSLSDMQVEKICAGLNFIVRKGAHFSIYGLLGILIALLLSQYGFYGIKQFTYSVFSAFLYACTDEFHQTFVKGRSGQLRDVGIDTAGAICAVAVLLLLTSLIKKFRKRGNFDGLY
jgi:VanZ family protein